MSIHVMFRAALFTTAKMWKQPECPQRGEWRSERWAVHTMEYYSPIKKRESLQTATTWMDLEDIKLSDISWLQKDKHCMIPLK